MSTSSTSNSLAKRPAPGSLMPPLAAPNRIKRPQIVLDEDTYTSAVAHIIRRDFFPGLAETDATHEYLDALKSENEGWIREAGDRLKVAMTPLPAGSRKRKRGGERRGIVGGDGGGVGETPRGWVGDTPLSVSGTEVGDEEGQREEKPDVDLSLSLTAFQNKYISEDQESFTQLLDKQNAKKFVENAWLREGNRWASKQRLAQQKVLEASKSTEEGGKEGAENGALIRLSQDLSTRPAAPNTHKHTPFNTLMFAPSSIEDWAPTRAQRAETASLAPPKAMLHHNTRLPPPPSAEEEIARPPSPTLTAVNDAIHNQPRHTRSEAAYTGNETPRVNGYAFVDARPPSPPPPAASKAPRDLLEKFEIKANPSPFSIQDSDRREKVHLKMVDRINANRAAKENDVRKPEMLGAQTPRFLSAPKAGMTPKPGAGMTPGRKELGSLTPAAQRLFARAGGGSGGTPVRKGGEGGFGGSGLGREWTPTPKVRRRA